MDPFRGISNEPGVDRHRIARKYFAEEMCVMLKIECAGVVPAVKLRREAKSRVQIVTGIVENSHIPTHIHVPVAVCPVLGNNHIEACGSELTHLRNRD